MGEDSSSMCGKTTSGFRCLCMTRFAVALVVTVLAAVVVVRGLSLVLRPGLIDLNISRSNVFVLRYETTYHTYYSFRFYLEATNPSELVFVYYRHITVQLIDTFPSAPHNNVLAEFSLNPYSLSLSPKEEQEYLAYGYAKNVSQITIDKLFTVETKEGMIDRAVMVLSGIVVVDNIKQGIAATYYASFNCQPVTIRRNDTLPKPSSGNFKADCLRTVS